jgi:hypothetical protein
MSYQRPKIQYGAVSFPSPREGSDGDIQIRSTNLGAKLFGKAGGAWYGSPLTSTEGTPIMRMGVTLANHLAISPDKLEFIKGSKSMLSITNTGDINMTGKIVITSIGTANVCIGTGNVDLGENNISIGVGAGSSIESGANRNVCIGNDAGEQLTTGDRNVYIGNRAGDGSVTDSSTGGSNTAIGDRAFSENTGDSNLNTAIGNQALLTCTIGDGNTAVGALAGNVLTEGSQCTAVGSVSNFNATANNQTCIGYGSATDGANQVHIGNTSVSECEAQVTFGTYSDERIKANITDSTIGLNFINELRPRRFTMRCPADYPDEIITEFDKEAVWTSEQLAKVSDGLIAQEVKEALDTCNESFSGWREKNCGIQVLQYGLFVPPLIKSIQELSAKIDTMQEEINNLKAE